MSAGVSRLLIALLLFLSTMAVGVLLKDFAGSRKLDASRSLPTQRFSEGKGIPLPAVVLPAREARASAQIRTDKRSYSPGQIVVITGSGWEPGETVCLLVHETSSKDPDALFFATADAGGNVFNDQFSPDPINATTTFALTARGQNSELQAQATFAHRRSGAETSIAPKSRRPDRPTTDDVGVSQNSSSTRS
jgi:hypothetical protein